MCCLLQKEQIWTLTSCCMRSVLCASVRDLMRKWWWTREEPAQWWTFTMRKRSWKVRTIYIWKIALILNVWWLSLPGGMHWFFFVVHLADYSISKGTMHRHFHVWENKFICSDKKKPIVGLISTYKLQFFPPTLSRGIQYCFIVCVAGTQRKCVILHNLEQKGGFPVLVSSGLSWKHSSQKSLPPQPTTQSGPICLLCLHIITKLFYIT